MAWTAFCVWHIHPVRVGWGKNASSKGKTQGLVCPVSLAGRKEDQGELSSSNQATLHRGGLGSATHERAVRSLFFSSGSGLGDGRASTCDWVLVLILSVTLRAGICGIFLPDQLWCLVLDTVPGSSPLLQALWSSPQFSSCLVLFCSVSQSHYQLLVSKSPDRYTLIPEMLYFKSQIVTCIFIHQFYNPLKARPLIYIHKWAENRKSAILIIF